MSSRTAFRPVFGPKTEQQSKRATQRARRRSRRTAVDTRLANSVTGVYPSRRRHPVRRRRAPVPGASANAITSDYIATLNDPFNYPGVRIGFGCLIPTQMTMAYVKGTFTPNADGSFRVCAIPWNCASGGSNGTIGVTSISGVSTTPSYTSVISANQSQMVSAFAFGRVVSGAVRVSVKYPATSTAGILNCYSIPTNGVTIATSTITTDLSLSQAKLAGSDGAQVLFRPTDFNDMNFTTLSGVTQSLASSQLYIDGMGYPTGSVIYYEIVWHLEVYNTTGVSTSDIGQQSGYPTLSDIHASAESMMSKVRSNLLPELIL